MAWTRYYPGAIARDRRDGTFDVAYDDGETEPRVDARLIRGDHGHWSEAEVERVLQVGGSLSGPYLCPYLVPIWSLSGPYLWIRVLQVGGCTSGRGGARAVDVFGGWDTRSMLPRSMLICQCYNTSLTPCFLLMQYPGGGDVLGH